MCLVVNQEATDKLRNSGKKFIYAYKSVSYWRARNMLQSPLQTFTWDIGWNQPLYPIYDWTIQNGDMLGEGGLHVFLNKQHNSYMWGAGSFRLMPVRCYIKDLIAVGGMDSPGEETAMFKRVYVEKRFYQKTIKEFNS